MKAIAIPGKRVSEPDAKDVADEFAAAANASGATFVFGVDDKSHSVLGIAREKLDIAETWVRDICNDPNAFIQAVAYRGTERNANEQVDARDITGPLDVQIAEACHFVKRNMRIAAIKIPARLDIPQYALNAIFEAVVNAVAHRDYSIAESKIRIHMFSDRIEMFSPGALPNSMTVEELSERQFSRNELICTCLSRCPIKEAIPDVVRTTIMDRRGEGVPVILGASRALSKKTPEYRLIDGCELKLTIRVAEVATDNNVSDINYPVNSESHPVNSEIRPVNPENRPVNEKSHPVNGENRPVNADQERGNENVAAYLLTKGVRKDLRENMVSVFVRIAGQPNLSYDALCMLTHLPRTVVRTSIAALKDYRLLKRIGSDKTGHWQTFFPPYSV